MQPDVLDAEILRELHSLDPGRESGLLRRLSEKFRGRVAHDLDGLSDSIGYQRMEDVRQHAHSLKSSSSSLGALTLAAACNDLEQAAGQEDLSEAMSLLERIRAEYVRVEQALREECH